MRFAIVFLIGLTLIGLTAWTVPALADDGDDWPDCNAASVESGIDACTRILQRGEASTADLSVAYTNRGLAYSNGGDNDSAIADIDQALRLDPQNATAYNNRGAIGDLNRSLRLNPRNATA